MASPNSPNRPAPPPAVDEIRACRICADRFAATATAHAPRPVLQIGAGARVLIVGQAPGARVHASGRPFTDPSGDRLRDWMGVDSDVFYDPDRVAILPMAFCFPGYDARGSDLPPPPICAATWRARLMDGVGPFTVTLLVGAYAHRYHLGGPGALTRSVKQSAKQTVTQTVADWRRLAPAIFPLPHPSWRNTAWLKRNPWFARDLLPDLRARLKEVLT